MKILALYVAGETISWQDRMAIECLKKLGFPKDYTDLLSKYGWGVFAFGLQIRVPSRFLPKLVNGLNAPLEVASRDDGIIYASDHVGKILFEFIPRSPEEHEVVFYTFDEVLAWSMARDEPKFPIPLFEQAVLPQYTLRTKEVFSKDSDQKLIGRLREVITDGDLEIARWHDNFYAFSYSRGVLLRLQNGNEAKICYALGRPIKPIVLLLREFGFVHESDESEDTAWERVSGD